VAIVTQQQATALPDNTLDFTRAALVYTYNVGLAFALLLMHVVVLVGAYTLLKILHYCPIPPCFQASAYCTVACSLAQQPFPAALPGTLPDSLSRQPFPAAFQKVTNLITGQMPACSIAYFFRPKAGTLLQVFPQ
jgi:hypothetical protein